MNKIDFSIEEAAIENLEKENSDTVAVPLTSWISYGLESMGSFLGNGLVSFTGGFSFAILEKVKKSQAVQELVGLKDNLTEKNWGQAIGSTLNTQLKNFLFSTDLSELSSEITKEIGDAFKTGVKSLDMQGSSNLLTKEMSDSFKKAIKSLDMQGSAQIFSNEFASASQTIRELFFNELDSIRRESQTILGHLTRDVTLKMIPWIAFGGSLLVGAPLLTHYVYKRVVHNIGRPKLAQEIRKVGIWDRTTDRAVATVSSIWEATKVGLQTGAITAVAGISLTFSAGIVSLITRGDIEYTARVVSGLACGLGIDSYRWCDSSPAVPLIAATVGAGFIRGAMSVASDFSQYISQAIKKDPKPVFSQRLQERIDSLTQAAYTIRRNGGYMQNLLLYGPGGTGKTMIAHYIAKHSKMNYMMMSGGDLAQYIKRGEHVSELNKIFTDIKSCHTPTILFIDECESLCGNRKKMDRSELIELVNALLNHTGKESKQVMLILATNNVEDLDSALLTRMDHKLYIGPPEEAERKKILELYIPMLMNSSEMQEIFTESRISLIAQKTEGFTGRLLFKMLNAISCKRFSLSSKKLTEKIVEDMLESFILQENEMIKRCSQPHDSLQKEKFTIGSFLLKFWENLCGKVLASLKLYWSFFRKTVS